MCQGLKVSAVAVMALDGLVSVQCSQDSINEVMFCDFLERHLLPHLLLLNGVNPLSVVLQDNASIHHTARSVELIQSVSALVHYLTAYSPDLQPNWGNVFKSEGVLTKEWCSYPNGGWKRFYWFRRGSIFNRLTRRYNYLGGMNMLDTLTRNKMYIEITTSLAQMYIMSLKFVLSLVHTTNVVQCKHLLLLNFFLTQNSIFM